jgi:hypothetical protein
MTCYEQSPDYGGPSEPAWRSIILGSLLIAAGAITLAFWLYR